MKGIDLDPASCAKANKVVNATKYFCKRQDGLRQEWRGRVFLNPPGGKVKRVGDRWVVVPAGPGESSMKVWWNRLATAWQAGTVTEAFFVGFTLEILRTSQSCVLPIQQFPRCYPRERMAFGGDQPTHANVIFFLPRPRDATGAQAVPGGSSASSGLCERMGQALMAQDTQFICQEPNCNCVDGESDRMLVRRRTERTALLKIATPQ